MLFLFRSNQFFTVFFLAVYVLLLHLPALSGAIAPIKTLMPEGLLYQKIFGGLASHPFWSALTACMLVFFQAIFVNLLADSFRILEDRNWFPGLFYALTASALPEFLFVSAPMVAAGFIPASIWRIYQTYQKPQVSIPVFEAAFWVAVAALFYPPAIWWFPAAWIGISIVRGFRGMEPLVFFTGAVTPFFLGWLVYFWADKGVMFREVHFKRLIQWHAFDQPIDTDNQLRIGLVAIFGLLLVSGLNQLYKRKGNVMRKYVGVLIWFLALSAVSVLFQRHWFWEHLMVSLIVTGLLIAVSMQHIKNRQLAGLIHGLMVASVFLLQFSAPCFAFFETIFKRF